MDDEIAMRELTWKLAECRGKCERLARDNADLRQLLGYAEQAIMAEYSAHRDDEVRNG